MDRAFLRLRKLIAQFLQQAAVAVRNLPGVKRSLYLFHSLCGSNAKEVAQHRRLRRAGPSADASFKCLLHTSECGGICKAVQQYVIQLPSIVVLADAFQRRLERNRNVFRREKFNYVHAWLSFYILEITK